MKASPGWAQRFVDWRFAAIALFLASGLLFSIGIGGVRYPVDDTSIHVSNAYCYQHGLLGPDNWWTTPLKHLMLRVSIAVAGNDPIGWRIRNVLFAAGVVALVFTLARKLFADRRVVLCATLLTALDPSTINWARSTTEDLVATFFVLLAAVFWLRAREREGDLDWVAMGISLGLSIALRWSAAAPMACMVALALYENRHEAARVARIIGYTVFVPCAIYVLPYLPWMARGNDFVSLFGLHVDAVRVQAMGMAEIYGSHFAGVASTKLWLVDFVGVTSTKAAGPATVVRQALINNPPVWALCLPASGYLVVRAWKKQRVDWLLVAVQFPLVYGLFALSARPFLLYSSVIFLPFGFLALAYSVVRVAKSRSWTVIAALVAWDVYLLPLSLGLAVPPWLHGWIGESLARYGAML